MKATCVHGCRWFGPCLECDQDDLVGYCGVVRPHQPLTYLLLDQLLALPDRFLAGMIVQSQPEFRENWHYVEERHSWVLHRVMRDRALREGMKRGWTLAQ